MSKWNWFATILRRISPLPQRSLKMNLRAMADVLTRKEAVTFTARGMSMTGRVSNGQTVTVIRAPTDLTEIPVGAVVLAKVHGYHYLHLVKAKDPNKGLLISNAKGRENGWTKQVYGLLKE